MPKHLVRIKENPEYVKTACGLGTSKHITTNPKDVSCLSCIRCMTQKEVRKYLGG